MAALPGQFIALQVCNVLKDMLFGYVLIVDQSYSFSTHFIEIKIHVFLFQNTDENVEFYIYLPTFVMARLMFTMTDPDAFKTVPTSSWWKLHCSQRSISGCC